ncbi:MAG: peptidylprolyl isomerase [Labilithrix sp.]|nr:peptidylprolyl isomerase [Labilithrix sp.]
MVLAGILARSFPRSVVVLGALAACSSTGSSGGDTTPPGRYTQAPAMTIDTSKTYAATMVTSKGTIELSLDAKAAPATVNNFVFLAREKFYDGLTFHRVEPSFVIQGGDPNGNGSGGPGYRIPDEASGLLHVDGALAMAKSAAPNSAGSQFYITLGPQTDLDGRYTVFGAVTNGKNVASIIAVGDVITSVTITEQ